MYNEIKNKTIEEISVKIRKLSYADALKSNIEMPDKNKQNLLIIKQRENKM